MPYHAGNFADVLKHALLVRLLRALQKKDKGFVFVDTHAGRGSYDLSLARPRASPRRASRNGRTGSDAFGTAPTPRRRSRITWGRPRLRPRAGET